MNMKDAEIAVNNGVLIKENTRKEECIEGTKMILKGLAKKKSQEEINIELKKAGINSDERFVCYCMAGQFLEDNGLI